jgi:hypothetical protein
MAVIFSEMFSKIPLFPGGTEVDQIHCIFKLLGTPTKLLWPSVRELPYWRNNFPCFEPRDIGLTWSCIHPSSLQLLKVRAPSFVWIFAYLLRS